MSEECDSSTLNGHYFCTIPYTGAYNLNEYIKIPKNIDGCSGALNAITGQEDSDCYTEFNDDFGKITRLRGESNLKNGKGLVVVTINKGPKVPVVNVYMGGTERERSDIENKSAMYPTDEELYEEKTQLIMGIEMVKDDKSVGRISGLYYSTPSTISKTSKWKGYNEGGGKIDLTESNRKDIHDDETDFKGNRALTSSKTLLVGSYQDSCLCGIWYRTAPNINDPPVGICLAFRRFFDTTLPTEYVYFNRGIIQRTQLRPNNDWNGNECNRGEFISQISLYYNDFDKSKVEQRVKIAGFPIVEVLADMYSIGFKGFGMYRSINYAVKDGLYKWVSEVKPLRCCQLLQEDEYEDDTVEKYVCREYLNYKVNKSFPNLYPNDQCKVLLGNWCNSSGIDNEGNEYYNIEDQLCEKACNITDINCDKGINDFCRTPQFKSSTGSSSGYDISNLLKNKICGCMTDINYDNIDKLKSVSLSISDVLNKKLLNKEGVDFTKKECLLPSCSETPFKLLNMKKNLVDKPCNEKERCFGNGFMAPSFADTSNSKIACLQFANDDECIDPITPDLSIIPNPFDNSCKNLLDKQVPMPQLKPKECIYSVEWYPEDIFEGRCEMHVDPEDGVEKLMLKRYRQLKAPSIPTLAPGADNQYCPPKCGENNSSMCKEGATSSDREIVEKWIICPYDTLPEDDITPPNNPTNTGFSMIVITILIALAISVIIKLIKK
jgi:hypothetical protein